MFFLPKTSARTALASWLLIIIITSTTLISFHNYLIITTAFITLVVGGTVIFSLQKQWFLNLIKILIFLFAHVALLLMMKVSPVIIVLPDTLMIVLLYGLLVLLLPGHFFNQLTMIILGSCLGELLYGVILNSLYMFYVVGNFLFLSRLMLVILMLMIFHFIKYWRRALLYNPHTIERGKLNNVSIFNVKPQQQ